MRVFLSLITSSVLALSGAQSISAKDYTDLTRAELAKSHKHHKKAYVKPGAAVSLSHDYDGKTHIGEFETLTASLSHIYQDGTVSVDLLAPDSLQITAFSPLHNMPVQSGSSLDLPIQFSAREAGNSTISLQVIYKTPMGDESRRVLSIDITIGGDISGKVADAQDADVATTSQKGLIRLPAIEVIE